MEIFKNGHLPVMLHLNAPGVLRRGPVCVVVLNSSFEARSQIALRFTFIDNFGDNDDNKYESEPLQRRVSEIVALTQTVHQAEFHKVEPFTYFWRGSITCSTDQ